MKRWTVSVAVVVCFVIAGQACAQISADTFRKAGAAYFKAGQFQQSVKAYQQVIRLAPNDADAYQQLGEAYTRLNMNKEAAAAFEKQADLLMSGGAGGATPTAIPVAATARPQSPTENGQLTYKVGQRVEYVDDGRWYKAIIIGVRDDRANQLDGRLYAPYRVHPIGFSGYGSTADDKWVCCADFSDHRSQLRAAGSGPTEPIPGGEAKDPVARQFPATGIAATPPAPTATAPPASDGRKYKVGQRVDYHYDGKWLTAIITNVRDNDRYQYRVHPIGYETTMDTWVPEDPTWLRPAGSGPTETVPGGEGNDATLKALGGTTAVAPSTASKSGAVPAREYHCVYSAGGQLVDVAPLTITGGSTYTDSDGKRGTYSSSASTLTFHGGNYDGQRAQFETTGGQPQLHILSPAGRPVIDCD